MITLVLGGSRSGKSELAERLASASARENACLVTYVATMIVGDDVLLAKRVARHRSRRPSSWHTVDAGPDLPRVLTGLGGTVLVDALGPWVAGHEDFDVDINRLCTALGQRGGDTIVVSDEVGLGVVPATEIGGLFRDVLGTVNQAVAAVADRVLFVVAGRVLPLERAPES